MNENKKQEKKAKIILQIVVLAAFCTTLTGCSDSKKNKLVYVSNDLEFILNKTCIVDISPIETGDKNNHLVAIKLKNSTPCSKKLNSLVSKNIGSDLYIYYNSDLVIKAHISSPLNTEKGYRQAIPNKTILDDVLSTYSAL